MVHLRPGTGLYSLSFLMMLELLRDLCANSSDSTTLIIIGVNTILTTNIYDHFPTDIYACSMDLGGTRCLLIDSVLFFRRCDRCIFDAPRNIRRNAHFD